MLRSAPGNSSVPWISRRVFLADDIPSEGSRYIPDKRFCPPAPSLPVRLHSLSVFGWLPWFGVRPFCLVSAGSPCKYSSNPAMKLFPDCRHAWFLLRRWSVRWCAETWSYWPPSWSLHSVCGHYRPFRGWCTSWDIHTTACRCGICRDTNFCCRRPILSSEDGSAPWLSRVSLFGA